MSSAEPTRTSLSLSIPLGSFPTTSRPSGGSSGMPFSKTTDWAGASGEGGVCSLLSATGRTEPPSPRLLIERGNGLEAPASGGSCCAAHLNASGRFFMTSSETLVSSTTLFAT